TGLYPLRTRLVAQRTPSRGMDPGARPLPPRNQCPWHFRRWRRALRVDQARGIGSRRRLNCRTIRPSVSKRGEMMLDELRHVPLFAQLSDEQLQWIADHSSEIYRNTGDTLFLEESPATHFYVLLAGELQITKKVGGQEMMLITHDAGAFTGEIPLLTN